MEWGGESFSCDSPQFIAMKNIVFEQVYFTEYFNEIIGNKITNDTIVLNLKNDRLLNLEYDINSENAVNENELMAFLTSMFDLSMFYIFLIREDEIPSKKYEITKKEQVQSRICESLNWTNPKDILLFKKAILL